MRSVKASVIAHENIGKCTVAVTVDKQLFKYKTREEIAKMITQEIYDAINQSIPLNKVKCRYYSFEGRCLGEKWAPECDVCGDVSKCKLLK